MIIPAMRGDNPSNLASFLQTLLLIICLLSFGRSQKCVEDVQLRHIENSNLTTEFSIETDTKKCSDNYPKVTRSCTDSELDVSFRSIAVVSQGSNVLPYVNLSISVTAHTRATDIFIRLQCLYAPSFDDDYCHNHYRQINEWGRMIWPCRSLKLHEPNKTEVPYRFAYSCLRMFGLSQYAVNVTISPQMCSSLYYVTIPMESQVHPEINEVYYDPSRTDRSWSPLVIIDTNPPDGVWIRYTEQKTFTHNEINVTIYKEGSTSALYFAHSRVIKKPNTGFKWKNIEKGSYAVYVYVERHDCALSCPHFPSPYRNCTVCPHTQFNFTLSEDKFSAQKREELLLKEATRHLVFSLSGLVVLVALVLVVLVVYIRVIRPRRLARLPPQNVELQNRPKVLLIYSDDCEEHSEVVLALSELLRDYGNASVYIDQLDLVDPKIRPMAWFYETIAAMNYVIFVFSESTPRILDKERMLSKKHYPDMFSTAVESMFTDVHQNDNWSKYVFVRMCYSPTCSIPEYLNRFPARRVTLPDEFGILVGHLHNVGANAIIDHNADLSKLVLAIQSFQQFNQKQTNWLNERFVTGIEDENSTLLPQSDIPLKPLPQIPAREEQIKLANDLMIEPPPEDNEEKPFKDSGLASLPTFALIGSPDDDSSDSSSVASSG